MNLLALAWLCALAEPMTGAEVAPVEESSQPVLIAQAALHYPEEALAEQAHGDVTVRVHVSEEGDVSDASFVEGPEVFRAEALRAARRLRFEPALRSGEPVPALIDVRFHFAPPDHDHPEPVYEIVVGVDWDRLDMHSRETLDGEALDRRSGESLAGAIDDVAGVQMGGGSGDTAKPIIRGQVERRLLLLNDGIRHESQKWGPDHAPEIDPFSAGTVSVVRGAAGVRYGPDAIGGVILVDPPAMRTEPGVGGKALLMGSSNGRKGYAALRLDVSPMDALSLRVEGNLATGADLRAPDYVLGNTASRLANAGLRAQYRAGSSELTLGFHRFHQQTGVFYGVQTSSPEAFLQQLDQPLNADGWTSTYAIDDPRQAVTHDLASARLVNPLGSFGELETTYSFQLNRRQEFEQTRDSIDGPQFDFTLRTHALEVSGLQHSHALGHAAAEGGFGVQLSFQENVYEGLPLVPNHRGLSAGAHVWERLSFPRVAVEGGLRYDRVGRTAFLTQSAYERHQRRGTLDPRTCDLADSVARCPRGFDVVSTSVGALWDLVPDTLDAKLDLSTAGRVPQVDELLLNGSAPSLPVYAIGSPNLPAETTWGASPTLAMTLPGVRAEASVYANLIDSYIYFAPERTDDGQLAFEATVRGSFPRYRFTPISALFYGADGTVVLGEETFLGLTLSGSLVRAVDIADGSQLVGTVADRGRAVLHVRPGDLGPVAEPFLDLGVDLVGSQTRVDPSHDFAPAPDGVALFSARLGVEIPTRAVDLTVGVEGRNLTDARYREYTSLLRYFADQPGRDLRLRIGATF